jgi:hypothetical protein
MPINPAARGAVAEADAAARASLIFLSWDGDPRSIIPLAKILFNPNCMNTDENQSGELQNGFVSKRPLL